MGARATVAAHHWGLQALLIGAWDTYAVLHGRPTVSHLTRRAHGRHASVTRTITAVWLILLGRHLLRS